MVIGIIAIFAMNAIDTFFVAMLGHTELAAMSFTFPVVSFVASIALGVGIGATSVVSRAIGAGRHDEVRRLTTDALALGLVVVGVTVAIGLLTIDPLFRALGATDDTMPLVRTYMTIWYLGVPFVVVPMVGNSAIRATGDTRTPARIMIGAALANAVLDPLFIFGLGPFPELGMAGAALTTVVSRAFTLVFALWILIKRERMVEFSQPPLRVALASWRAVLAVGAPAAATNVVAPVSIGVLTGVVATFGEPAVAAFGAGGRVESIALVLPIAVSTALGPFVGQNWGADRADRVRRAYVLAAGFALAWGVVAWAGLALAAPWLAGAFADEPAVVEPLIRFLRISPLGLGPLGVIIATSATFNAINRPLRAAALVALRAFGVLVPAAWLGAWLLGLDGVFWALVAANVVTAGVAFAWARGVRKG